MQGPEIVKIALLGNPNSGKSSLFNHLTGLNQKVGNFPGVTVDKKTGTCTIGNGKKAFITDLPGTYSIYPRTLDERVVFDFLQNTKTEEAPDVVVVVVDASNLKRNLLLFSQIMDLGIPVVMALNMMDIALKLGYELNTAWFEKAFGVPVVEINARLGFGLHELKDVLGAGQFKAPKPFIDLEVYSTPIVSAIKSKLNLKNDYTAYLLAQQFEDLINIDSDTRNFVQSQIDNYGFNRQVLQAKETIARYKKLDEILAKLQVKPKDVEENKTSFQLDSIITHKYFGYILFFGILFLIFQAIFSWAEVPMDFIDESLTSLSQSLSEMLPQGKLSDLLTQGVIPGLAGILMFVPQIAILFAFISILEESGYMARVVVLMDKIMRRFGLNGKSVVPLISGVACAIPAVMSARSIDNWKERTITIFVTPLMSCSARLPIYTMIIALVIPSKTLLGFINLQGLVLFAMYVLGLLAALSTAFVMKGILKSKSKGFFVMELPTWKAPRWSNVALTIYEKVKTFIIEAGKVILAIAIILWVLATYGPTTAMLNATSKAEQALAMGEIQEDEFDNLEASYKLEASFAGIAGRYIEPAIRPLGFDWKIGIALITSFAAREVFVGTIATIYSIGSEDEDTIRGRLESEINPRTGNKMYNLPMGLSLLVFYAFAMQCMSTLAIVYRETKGWKWPLLQLAYMTSLAYIASLIVFNIFS